MERICKNCKLVTATKKITKDLLMLACPVINGWVTNNGSGCSKGDFVTGLFDPIQENDKEDAHV